MLSSRLPEKVQGLGSERERPCLKGIRENDKATLDAPFGTPFEQEGMHTHSYAYILMLTHAHTEKENKTF